MARVALAWAGTGFWSRWVGALGALLALAACQSAAAPEAAQPADGWHVIERLGHARFQPPGATEWMHVPAAGVVPDGSRLITGRGGRLILADGGRQLVAGAACELELPHRAGPAGLRQTAGQVRYRVLDGPALIVEAPFFNAEMAAGVLDATVTPDGAEARVVDGSARIVTPDGRAGATLAAGQSAFAKRGGPGYMLARRTEGGMLEAVPASVELAAESAGTAAKLSAPQARLLAETGSPGRHEAGLGWSAPQQTTVVAEAVEMSQPPPPAELMPRPAVEPPAAPLPPPERPRLAEPRSQEPAARPRERWSEPPTGATDIVIVPARYRSAQADRDLAGKAGPNTTAPMIPSAERNLEGSNGAALEEVARRSVTVPKDARQTPFDRLGAGLLEGLAPALLRSRDRTPAPAARRL